MPSGYGSRYSESGDEPDAGKLKQQINKADDSQIESKPGKRNPGNDSEHKANRKEADYSSHSNADQRRNQGDLTEIPELKGVFSLHQE